MRRIYKAGQIPSCPGDAERMAEIIRCRRAPGDKGTDRTLFEGKLHNHGLEGTPDWMVKEILADAKAAGISTTGKVWQSALGPADDPKAWVSDMHDVIAVAKERNLEVRGAVNVKAHEAPPPKTVRMAEDLIQDHVAQALAENPDRGKDIGLLRHEIVEKHTKA